MAGRQGVLDRLARAVPLALILALATPLALAPALALADDSQPPSPDRKVAYTHRAMGTIVSLTLWTDDDALAARGAAAAFNEFDRVDRLMSSWREGSGVAALNSGAGGAPVVVDAELLAVITAAQGMARKSSGAFDITVGSYRGLWKFDQDRDGSIPSDADVAARKQLVNYRDVVLNTRRKTIKLRKKGQRITLGGVAKGYAVDRAVAILREMGLPDFILQAGGDLYVSGKKDARQWTVGIRDPRGGRAESFAVTELEDRTFSTSGDYERSVVLDGVRYHHILDPATGHPAVRSRSVTVIAKSAMTADMWSTALFVIGPDRGLAMVEANPEIEAVFVDSHNKVRVSSGLAITRDRAAARRRGLVGKLLILKDPTPGI